jgi:hypothetical protein
VKRGRDRLVETAGDAGFFLRVAEVWSFDFESYGVTYLQ